MTLEEAEREWDKLVWRVIEAAGAKVEQIIRSDEYHDLWLFELLTGEQLTAKCRTELVESAGSRLQFWALKFREYKDMRLPGLNRFLIERINKLRGRHELRS